MPAQARCKECGKEMAARSGAFEKLCSVQCRAASRLRKRVRDGEARCLRCKAWRPLGMFVLASRRRPNGEGYTVPHSHCKLCNAQRSAANGARKGARAPAKRDPEHARIANRLRLHAVRAAGQGPGVRWIRSQLERQGHACVYCCRPLPPCHIDHVIPIARGGTNDHENLHLSCPLCNLRKGARTHDEFLTAKNRPARWRPPGG